MRIYPDLIFSAEQNQLSVSAFRVWILGKGFCRAGGTVPVRAFKDYLEGLGVKRSTYFRWIKSALELGLLIPEGGSSKRPAYYRLASWLDGARLAGVQRLSCPIEMPVEKLLTTSWKAEVWAGRLLQVRNRTTVEAKIYKDQSGQAQLEKVVKQAKPISRRTLEAVSGVKRRTQQNREKKAQVKQQSNVLVHQEKRGGFLPYGSIDEQPELMVTSGGTVIEQLPNSREVSPDFQRVSSRSGTKKRNKALLALCKRDVIAAEKAEFPLRYIDSLQQGKAILKHSQAVTILQSAGASLSGAMAWKVFSYGF